MKLTFHLLYSSELFSERRVMNCLKPFKSLGSEHVSLKRDLSTLHLQCTEHQANVLILLEVKRNGDPKLHTFFQKVCSIFILYDHCHGQFDNKRATESLNCHQMSEEIHKTMTSLKQNKLLQYNFIQSILSCIKAQESYNMHVLCST